MKHYLVIGGTGGIGAATSRILISQGYAVTLAARGQERLDSISEEIGSRFFRCDATREEEVAKLFEEASSLGEITGVVHAVGSILLKPAHLTSTSEWDDTLAKNLSSAFYVVKHSAKVMQEGSVVLFSSAAAQIGLPNHEAIAAAKAGIEGLVRSAAATYAGRGLRFNAIAPGLVHTPLFEKLLANPLAVKTSMGFHALGRLGEPSDIADIAAWLVSDKSSWVTGQVFTIDGGLSSVKKGA